VKVSGGDNFAAPDNEIRHLPGADLPNFCHDFTVICNELEVLCELTTGGGKVRICRLFFGQRQFFVNGKQDCNRPYVRCRNEQPFGSSAKGRNSFIFAVLQN